MQNWVKCNKIWSGWCNSLGPPRQMFLTNQTPIRQPSKQLLNACPIPPVHIIVRLLVGCQSAFLYSNETKGDKIRIGCLTPAFSGAQKRAEMLTSPLHSRGSPNKWGQNQKWLPHPCLLGGPKEGGNAVSPPHSRGSPTKGTKSDLKTYARGNNDAPGISKYGSLVRADAQIGALG